MDKRKRGRGDMNTVAARILRQATGQEPKRQPPPDAPAPDDVQDEPHPKKRGEG